MAFKIFRKVLEMLDVNAADITDGQVLAWDATNGEFIAADASAGGSGAPTNATYITQTHHASLSAEQALEDLATGIVKNTTTTGVLSIAAEGTDYYGPGGTDVALADGGTGASTAAGARTNLGLVIGSDVQAYDADLDTYAGITPSANVQALLGAANYAAIRSLLGLVIGTNVQAHDADLDTWAGLTPSAFFQTLVDDTDAATARATLGVIASLFQSGGAQAIKLDDLAAPDDNTDLNVSTSKHGLTPKLPNDATKYLDGTGAYSVPAGGSGGWTTVTKTVDESVASSVSLQADDELFFTAVSDKTYEIELTLIYASPAGGGTPDLKVAFGEDNVVRGSIFGIYIGAGDSQSTGNVITNQSSTLNAGTAAADRPFRGVGSHSGGGGTFQVLWSQSTSNGNATIVRAGSVLRYRLLN